MPITARIAVVLPAPLRPTRPTISPWPTDSATPSSATSSPNRLPRLSTESAEPLSSVIVMKLQASVAVVSR